MKLPELTIQHITLPSNKRILVTSDIHGHLSHFKKVLEKANFTGEDILMIVGDIIEKGPESLNTLRYIMSLCESGNVIPLLGNVDAWRLQMINDICAESVQSFYDYLQSARLWYGTSFFDELTKELGFISTCPEDILKSKEDIIAHFENELSFLAGLPSIVETQNYIFVHGGLYEKNADDNCSRGLYEILRYGNFMDTSVCFDKYVIAGHTPVSLYGGSIAQCNPMIDNEKKIISIDGGCGIKSFGQLNLLIIPEINCSIGDIYYVNHDELPVFRAVTPQEESANPVYIRWVDNKIKILEKAEETSYIEHLSTGRRLWMPNAFILDDTRCYEYTDYAPPVGQGDLLSLVKEFPNGFLVKKNGVLGWYYGKLEKV